MKLTDFEKWIIDQALNRYLTEAKEQLRLDKLDGKVSIITSEYLEMTGKEIYQKLKLNIGE
jgi:tetrahydromethanopterin S-methyltransferase subunit G